MKDEKQSLVEWYKDLYPDRQMIVAGATVAAALGAILGYLLFGLIPDDFPIEPFPFLAIGLLGLYLGFRNLRDKWD